MVGEEIDPGTRQVNTIDKNLGLMTTNFLQIPLYEVYAMHIITVVELKVRKGVLIKR